MMISIDDYCAIFRCYYPLIFSPPFLDYASLRFDAGWFLSPFSFLFSFFRFVGFLFITFAFSVMPDLLRPLLLLFADFSLFRLLPAPCFCHFHWCLFFDFAAQCCFRDATLDAISISLLSLFLVDCFLSSLRFTLFCWFWLPDMPLLFIFARLLLSPDIFAALCRAMPPPAAATLLDAWRFHLRCLFSISLLATLTFDYFIRHLYLPCILFCSPESWCRWWWLLLISSPPARFDCRIGSLAADSWLIDLSPFHYFDCLPYFIYRHDAISPHWCLRHYDDLMLMLPFRLRFHFISLSIIALMLMIAAFDWLPMMPPLAFASAADFRCWCFIFWSITFRFHFYILRYTPPHYFATSLRLICRW